MNSASRVSAVIAYIPIVGWLYVLFVQRKDALAVYHLRQSIGLFLFLLAIFVVWAVIAWLLAWIPYLAVLSASLFALVIVAWLYGIVAWIIGLIKALRNQQTPLPIFGSWAARLPIK